MGDQNPQDPRKRLTEEEFQEAIRKFIEANKIGAPVPLGFAEKVEEYYTRPAVQGVLAGGSLLSGGAAAALFGGAEAAGGVASAYNRYKEGDYPGAALSGAFTALGGQAAYRGARDLVRGSRVKELVRGGVLTAEEAARARAAMNLDPSLLSPELRRLVNIFREQGASGPGRVRTASQRIADQVGELRTRQATETAAAAAGDVDDLPPGSATRPGQRGPRPPDDDGPGGGGGGGGAAGPGGPTIIRDPPRQASGGPTESRAQAIRDEMDVLTRETNAGAGPARKLAIDQRMDELMDELIDLETGVTGRPPASRPAATGPDLRDTRTPEDVYRDEPNIDPNFNQGVGDPENAGSGVERRNPTPKPGEPGGRRLTSFEKHMREKAARGEASVGDTLDPEDFPAQPPPLTFRPGQRRPPATAAPEAATKPSLADRFKGGSRAVARAALEKADNSRELAKNIEKEIAKLEAQLKTAIGPSAKAIRNRIAGLRSQVKPKPSVAVKPTAAKPPASEPGWVTNGKPIEGPNGTTVYEQPDGRVVTRDGKELVRPQVPVFKPGQPRPAATGAKPKKSELAPFPLEPTQVELEGIRRKAPEVTTAIPGVPTKTTATVTRTPGAATVKLTPADRAAKNLDALKNSRNKLKAELAALMKAWVVAKGKKAVAIAKRHREVEDSLSTLELEIRNRGGVTPPTTPGKGGVAVEEPLTGSLTTIADDVSADAVRDEMQKLSAKLSGPVKRRPVGAEAETLIAQWKRLDAALSKWESGGGGRRPRGKPPLGGEPPAAPAAVAGGKGRPRKPAPVAATADNIDQQIASARAETGITPSPAVASAPVTPETAKVDLRRKVLADLVEQREGLIRMRKALPPGEWGSVRRDFDLTIKKLDDEIAKRTAALDLPAPPPKYQYQPPVGQAPTPEAPLTREDRIQRIRDGFGGAGKPPAPAPAPRPPAPAGPGLGLGVESGGAAPLPRRTPEDVVPDVAAAPTPAPVPAPAPAAPVLSPFAQSYIKGRDKLLALRYRLKSGLVRSDQDRAFLEREVKILEGRLKDMETKYPAVREMLEREAESARVAAAPALETPAPPVRKPRQSKKSPSPQETARIEAEMAEALERERQELERGRQPWRRPDRTGPPPEVLAGNKAERNERLITRALEKARKRLAKEGQASSNPTAGRLRATATTLRNQLKKNAPGLKADELAKAVETMADDVEKAPPRPLSRLIDKKTGKVIRIQGDPKQKDAGIVLEELLGLMAATSLGGVSGAYYGSKNAPEGEDKFGHVATSTATGALLGFLGSSAAIGKHRGQSLSKMGQRYQFFSLLSDLGVMGKANLGAANSAITMAVQRMGEKRYADAGKILRQFMRDVGPGWMKILAARDQSQFLPPVLRAQRARLHGRANIGTGYKIMDLPGRVISAGDIVSIRAGHAGGYSLDEIQNMNLGGSPQSSFARDTLSFLGEDVPYTETNAQGQIVRKIIKAKGGPGRQALLRTMIPFARMAVNLPERTIAYMPGVNMLKPAREAFKTTRRQELVRGALGAAAIGGGAALSNYTTPETDSWVTAAAGPMSGLASLGVGARRAVEAGQEPMAFIHQMIQNLAPGVSEQFNVPGIANRVIPSISNLAARMMDPAFDRSTGPSDLAEARQRTGSAETGWPDRATSLGEVFSSNIKSKLPYWRETVPEKYRGRTRWGQDLQPQRDAFFPRITSDTTMRGNIFGYDIVAPKWMAGSGNAAMPRFPVGDAISERVRDLEKQTGQPILGTPSQPLEDPLFTEIANAEGVPPPRLHRDIKAAIEQARGMAPRILLQEIITPEFMARPPHEQAFQARAMVKMARDQVSEMIKLIPRGSLAVPSEREEFVRQLQNLTKDLSGGWK